MVISLGGRHRAASILAYSKMYLQQDRRRPRASSTGVARRSTELLYNKYFVDEVYNATAVQGHALRCARCSPHVRRRGRSTER